MSLVYLIMGGITAGLFFALDDEEITTSDPVVVMLITSFLWPVVLPIIGIKFANDKYCERKKLKGKDDPRSPYQPGTIE